jgi:plasmid replication initiation protein
LEVSYKPLRTGRSITAIHFTIKEKEGLDFTKAMLERSIVLNRLEFEKNQMRLDGFGDDEDGNNGTEENG